MDRRGGGSKKEIFAGDRRPALWWFDEQSLLQRQQLLECQRKVRRMNVESQEEKTAEEMAKALKRVEDGLDSNKTVEARTVSAADERVGKTVGEKSIGGSADVSEATVANSTSEVVRDAGSQSEG